jgi:nucleoside-diphosphate-sugar epimerase
MKDKHVLITGASGFIGSYIIKELIHRGISFTAADKVMEKNIDIPEELCKLLNIGDKEAIINLLNQVKPDIVLHLAAIALVTHKSRSEIYDVNVCGTENLLEAVKQTCPQDTRVVLISTAGVYGNQKAKYYDELLPFRPVNHYSYSKMIMEILSGLYNDYMDIKIVRPFNIIGTGQSQSFFIPKLLHAFAVRQPVLSLGNLSSERDYVEASFIANVLAEMMLSDKLPHKIYNICTGIANTGHDIINILKEITGFEPKIEISDKYVRTNEVWRLVGCPDRLNEFLKDRNIMKPRPVESILESMYQDYLANKGK